MNPRALLIGTMLLAVVALPGVSAGDLVPTRDISVQGHDALCLGLPVYCMETEEDVSSPQVKDIYRFVGVPGTDYEIRVDTVAFATAFDPWARICTGLSGTTLTGCFAFGDDNFACSFPPPSFSCPRISGVLPETARTVVWYIGVASHPCCNGSFRTPGMGEYSLEVISAGALLELVHDNAAGNLP